MAVSDRRSFENCSQLVNLIRYHLGDPHEYVNKCHFPTGTLFAMAEGPRDCVIDQDTVYRHTINFSWVIDRPFPLEIEMPEISSPMITMEGCPRQWCLTMNVVWGIGNACNEHDVYLTCVNIEDASVRACVKLDLYKATDKVGSDASTLVSFDEMVPRHVVYTGVDLRSSMRLPETDDSMYDLSGTYTIQGIIFLSNCCKERRHPFPELEPGLLKRP